MTDDFSGSASRFERGLPSSNIFREVRASASDNMAVNATVRALNLPASGDIEGQAAYIQAMSDLLDALPDTPFHNATRARFQEYCMGRVMMTPISFRLVPTPTLPALTFICLLATGFSWDLALIEREDAGRLLLRRFHDLFGSYCYFGGPEFSRG
jgi:hypothetical protein